MSIQTAIWEGSEVEVLDQIPAQAFPTINWTKCSIRSTRPSAWALALDCPSRARSSRPTAARYGPRIARWRRSIPLHPAPIAGTACMSRTPPNIHIVDDDASFRTALGELLNACGYQVALYVSALQLLNTPLGRERAISLDVQMAGVSGPQLQDRLAELGCSLPIVFIPGHGDIPTTVQTIKAGADDFYETRVKGKAAAGNRACSRPPPENAGARRPHHRSAFALSQLTPRDTRSSSC